MWGDLLRPQYMKLLSFHTKHNRNTSAFITNKTQRRKTLTGSLLYSVLGFRRKPEFPPLDPPAKQCILNGSKIAKLFHCFGGEIAWGKLLAFYALNIKTKCQMGKWNRRRLGSGEITWEQFAVRRGQSVEPEILGGSVGGCRVPSSWTLALGSHGSGSDPTRIAMHPCWPGCSVTDK